jgi:hypothetical protein
MSMAESACVLLADPHHAVREGVRGLLATTFKAVVMVADEVSTWRWLMEMLSIWCGGSTTASRR